MGDCYLPKRSKSMSTKDPKPRLILTQSQVSKQNKRKQTIAFYWCKTLAAKIWNSSGTKLFHHLFSFQSLTMWWDSSCDTIGRWNFWWMRIEKLFLHRNRKIITLKFLKHFEPTGKIASFLWAIRPKIIPRNKTLSWKHWGVNLGPQPLGYITLLVSRPSSN